MTNFYVKNAWIGEFSAKREKSYKKETPYTKVGSLLSSRKSLSSCTSRT